MMAKVSVKGQDITALYQFLTDKAMNPQTAERFNGISPSF